MRVEMKVMCSKQVMLCQEVDLMPSVFRFLL